MRGGIPVQDAGSIARTEGAVVNHAVVADRSRIRPADRADARKAMGGGDDAHGWLDMTDGDVFRRAARNWRSKTSAPNGCEGPGEKAKARVHITMTMVTCPCQRWWRPDV